MRTFNITLSTHNVALMGDGQVTPEQDTVAFSSVLPGLGFNVKRFAKIDASKMSVNKVKMIKHFNGKTNVRQPKRWDQLLQ